ncbi:MAG: translation initiation factor IF-3 [Candidatus Buchananbacteria bacterium]
MRRSFRGKNTQAPTKDFRVNERIFSLQLMIIDEKGNPLGIMDKFKALQEASSRGLDLVEVSPKSEPPIAKFMDYGSFKYQKEKQERKLKSKTKTIDVKTIKVSSRIGQHDIDIRAAQAAKFLADGDKVRIELFLKGREHQHIDIAKESIKKMIDGITIKLEGKPLKIEQDVIKLGSKISAVISL